MRLQTKFTLLLVPICAIAVISGTALSWKAATTTLVDELAQRTVSQDSDLAAACGPGLRAKNEQDLLPRLQLLMRRNAAAYALVLDTAAVVRGHTDVTEKGRVYSDITTRRAILAEEPAHAVVDWAGGSVIDIAIPIWQAEDNFLLASERHGRIRLGTLRIGVPLDRIRATRSRITRQIGAIIGILWATGLALILWFLHRHILRGLGLLSSSAQRIGLGDYNHRVAATSDDEIGDLAHTFNRMTASLAGTTVSKDYLAGIIDSMGDTLLVTDSDGVIRMANRATAALLGYAPAELLGLAITGLFADAPQGLLDETRKAGQIINHEVNLLTKTGLLMPVLISGSCIRDTASGGTSLIVVARDISERKELEARILQTEKLSAIGQLAAGVAHEINNPLGVILGFAEGMAKRTNLDDPKYLPVRSIVREAYRCKEIVQNLLTFSRMGQKHDATFNLVDAVANALNLIEPQARVCSVELSRALHPEALSIHGNSNQIQQIVINLCNNALDAMPKGGKLTVSVDRAWANNKALARIQIQDTGGGIPKYLQGKIMEPFFTTKEPGKGTGLGLSLVDEMVARHNGSVKFSSLENQGTTFVVTLPLASA
ncbi:MAG: ATP-binding protein [Elusimicrobiota bacterium]|jgi:PAS domain S-box-containing protein